MTLTEKIQKTDLFSEEEREFLIKSLPTLPQDALDELEDLLDDYFESSFFLLQAFQKDTANSLEEMIKAGGEDAQNAKDIKEGLTEVIKSADQILHST